MTYLIVFFFTYTPLILFRYYSFGDVELSFVMSLALLCLLVAWGLGGMINGWRNFSKRYDKVQRLKRRLYYETHVKGLYSYERLIGGDRYDLQASENEIKRLEKLLAKVKNHER